MVSWNEGLQEVMVDYFGDLFKASNTKWSEVVDCIDPKISAEQNSILLAPVEENEVKRALFGMHPDKSLGPDCMSPGFYQKHCDIIRGDVITLVRLFFETCRFGSHVTETNIVLIPKTSNPTKMTELRPISLCNVSYKIVSKVLENRLKEVLSIIVSPT